MLTVVMATRNRARLLRRVLESFVELKMPRGGWKLVVVDNGSTDGTPDILIEAARRLPLEVIEQSRPGMNASLNAALGHIEGDLTVKTDDDVLPCRSWLVHYREAADAHPERSLFGGAVQPEWPFPPPSWLSNRAASFGILYASCDRPCGCCPLSHIYGPNWAVRTTVFAGGVRFNEGIGPDDTQAFYPMGGETEFFTRLEAGGHLGWFVPEAAARHIVRPEQMTERWILDRAYRNGLGVGITRPPPCARGFRFSGLPLALRIRLSAYSTLCFLARPLPPSSLRLGLLFRESWFRGLAESVRNGGVALMDATSARRPEHLLCRGYLGG